MTWWGWTVGSLTLAMSMFPWVISGIEQMQIRRLKREAEKYRALREAVYPIAAAAKRDIAEFDGKIASGAFPSVRQDVKVMLVVPASHLRDLVKVVDPDE